MAAAVTRKETDAGPAQPPVPDLASGIKTDLGRVDEALVEHETWVPLSFGFICFGLPFRAMVVTARDGSRLKFVADLGPLPLGAVAAPARESAAAIIAKGPVRRNGRFVLSQGKRVMFVSGKFLGDPPTPIETVAAVSAEIAALKPALDLMRRCLDLREVPPAQ